MPDSWRNGVNEKLGEMASVTRRLDRIEGCLLEIKYEIGKLKGKSLAWGAVGGAMMTLMGMILFWVLTR